MSDVSGNEESEADEEDLDHSRLLDVHTWSDYSEVNGFIDYIFATFFEGDNRPNVRKAHIKVVLLDLYVAWSSDPSLKISVHRNPNRYLPRNRELLSNLVFEGFGSCGDLVWLGDFNSVFERDACDDFGQVIKAA